MALGSDLIAAMNDLDDEIDTTSDATRALRALNRAQDTIELLLAKIPGVLGSTGTVTALQDIETTAEPSGLLSLERLHFIDPDTSLPSYQLSPVYPTGDVRTRESGLLANLVSPVVSSTGKPTHYNWYGGNFWWSPVPDAAHTIRYYGNVAASDITSVGTFAYGDYLISPITKVAVRYFKQKTDDPQADIERFAQQELSVVLAYLRSRWRDGPRRARTRRIHTA